LNEAVEEQSTSSQEPTSPDVPAGRWRSCNFGANSGQHVEEARGEPVEGGGAVNTLRDWKIARAYQAGRTLQAIADMHGLSKQRVQAILIKQGIARRPTGLPAGRAKKRAAPNRAFRALEGQEGGMAVVQCSWPGGLTLKTYTQITVDDTGPGINDAGMGDANSRKVAIPSASVSLVNGVNNLNAADSTTYAAWKAANPTSSLLGSVLFG
jgi:hypothetical protein